MKRIKWIVAAAVMGTLFFGCKAKEQTAEAPPPEQPKPAEAPPAAKPEAPAAGGASADRKSTRLNSSHANISYAVFCLKKKKNIIRKMKYFVSERNLNNLKIRKNIHDLAFELATLT